MTCIVNDPSIQLNQNIQPLPAAQKKEMDMSVLFAGESGEDVVNISDKSTKNDSNSFMTKARASLKAGFSKQGFITDTKWAGVFGLAALLIPGFQLTLPFIPFLYVLGILQRMLFNTGDVLEAEKKVSLN